MTDPLLPCGRDPLDVADHATAGRLDEHESQCPHCRREIDAAKLSTELGATVATAADVDDAPPPRDLVPTVMRSVRTELRTAREIPVTSGDGRAFVTDHVVASVLRDALDAAGGLVVASCRVELLSGTGLGVRVEAHGRYLDDLTDGAAAARDLVVRTLRVDFGLVATGGVDVAVVDLIGPAS
jgi:hypothetical protein